MSAQYRFNLFHVLGLLTVVVGAIVIVMACLAIAGWMFGFGVFPYLNQSGAHLGITPDAALCFILCWVSLWVLRESTGKFSLELEPDEPHKFDSENADERDKPEEKGSVHNLAVNLAAGAFSRRLAQLFASVAVVISLSVLAGYLFGLDVWPAQASGWATPLGPVLSAWGDFSGQGILSTRMAPSAAFAFLLNGVALTMLDVETRGGARPAQHLGLIALFLSLLIALGHVYQISPLQNFILTRGWPQMTTLMAIIFVALSIGVVCARPRNGLISLLGAANSGGYIARRLLPAAIVTPVIFGSGALLGVKAGYFEGSIFPGNDLVEQRATARKRRGARNRRNRTQQSLLRPSKTRRRTGRGVEARQPGYMGREDRTRTPGGGTPGRIGRTQADRGAIA
jgi:hypothetical protein